MSVFPPETPRVFILGFESLARNMAATKNTLCASVFPKLLGRTLSRLSSSSAPFLPVLLAVLAFLPLFSFFYLIRLFIYNFIY